MTDDRDRDDLPVAADDDELPETTDKTTWQARLSAVFATIATTVWSVVGPVGSELRDVGARFVAWLEALAITPDEIPTRAIQAVFAAVIVVASAVVVPVGPAIVDQPSPDASGVDDTTPTPAPTETPRSGETFDPESNAGADAEDLSEVSLNELPQSLVSSTPTDVREDDDVPDPSLRTSDGSQTMSVEAVERDGEIQLVLEDDRTHDGRWVSVSTTWLRDTVGTVPEVVQVTHESGTTYGAELRTRGDSAVFWVREFSSNTVAFESTVELRAESATDGSTIDYRLTDLDAASDPNVTLTGVTSTEWDNVSATAVSDGETLDLSVAGNVAPSGPSSDGEPVVVFTGRGSSTPQTVSGTALSDGETLDLSTGGNIEPTDESATITGVTTTLSRQTTTVTGSESVTVAGNIAPVGPASGEPEIVFEGETTTTAESTSAELSSGETTSLNVDGNIAAVDESVTVTGRTAIGSRYTPSATGSSTITVRGNIAPVGPASGEPEIVIEGRTKTTAESTSAELSSGETTSVTVGGNIAAVDESVTVTGRTEVGSRYTPSATGSSTITVAGNIAPVGPNSGEPEIVIDGETTIDPKNPSGTSGPGGSTSVSIGGNVNPSGPANGDPELTLTAKKIDREPAGVTTTDQYESVDVWGDATSNSGFVEVAVVFPNPPKGEIKKLAFKPRFPGIDPLKVDMYHTSGGVPSSVTDGTYVGSFTEQDVSSSGWTAVTLDTPIQSDGSKMTIMLDTVETESNHIQSVNTDTSPSQTLHYNFKSEKAVEKSPKVRLIGEPSGWSATVDGSTYSVGSGSQTTGISLGTGTTDLSFDGDGGRIEWSLDYDERTATEDPSVDVDGDGSAEASYSGILTAGETVTRQLAGLSEGSRTVSTSTGVGPAPSWTLRYDERIATEDPSVDVDGDGTDELSCSGIYREGETCSGSVDGLAPGSYAAELTTTRGSAEVAISWTERTTTEDPSVDVDGDGSPEASYSGTLLSGQTVTRQLSGLSEGSRTVSTSTSSGPVPSWTLTYDERTATEDPSVDVDGDGTDELSCSGIYTEGETCSGSVDGLAPGSYNAGLTTTRGSAEVVISWTERTATEDPSVDVDGDGSAEASYSGVLTAGETVTRQLSGLSEGSRTVALSSDVGPTPSGTLRFDPRTATEDPALDPDADGIDEISCTGIYREGETCSNSFDGLSPNTSYAAALTTTAGEGDVSISWTDQSGTVDPAIDVDADGSAEASISGVLQPGETRTLELPGLSTADDAATVSVGSGTVDTSVQLRERTTTQDATISLNGETTEQISGTLADGETTTLTLDKSALQSGENNVTIELTDTVSADAPIPKVTVDYEHDTRDDVTVGYSAEQFTERFRIEKTFATSRTNASLTVPFENRVLSVRDAEIRLNGSSSWEPISESAREFDGTTLSIDLLAATGKSEIPQGTTVEVRSNGSKVVPINGSVEVTDPQVVGETPLDVTVQLSEWDSTSRLGVTNAGLGSRLHYATNTSWSGESTARIDAQGRQRLAFDGLEGSGSARLRTLPIAVSVPSDETHVSVVDDNRTASRLSLSRGPEVNQVTIERLEAGNGSWVLLDTGSIVLDSADAIDRTAALSTSDETEQTVIVRPEESGFDSSGGSGSAGGAGGAAGPIGGGTGGPLDRLTIPLLGSLGTIGLFGSRLIPLVVVGLLLAGLIGASRNPDAVTPEESSIASGLSGVPVVGEQLGRVVAGLVSGGSDLVERILSSRLAVTALGVAIAIAGTASGAIPLPEGGQPLLLIGGAAALSFVGLRQTDELSIERWLAVNTLFAAVLIVSTSDADPVAALTDSQLFPLVIVGVLALAYRLIQGLRAEADTPDTVNRIVVDDSGGDD